MIQQLTNPINDVRIDDKDENLLSSKIIKRTFGLPEDYIEIHIYNSDDILIYSDYNYKKYKVPYTNNSVNGLTEVVDINPEQDLIELGFDLGKFKVQYNFFRRKISVNSNELFIKDISTNRKELKIFSNIITPNDLSSKFIDLINESQNSNYYKNYILNFGNNLNILAVNLGVENSSIPNLYLKLYNPLPLELDIKSTFNLVEEISEPQIFEVELVLPEIQEIIPTLRPPNFDIDAQDNYIIPSSYLSYNDLILNSNTSSLSALENSINNSGITVNADYEDYSSFIHFSSAKERLLNFKYKVSLLEYYQTQINNILAITGSTSASFQVSSSLTTFKNNYNSIIKNFDGYENFLYFTSGSNYTWPKSNTRKPYTLYSSTSNTLLTWLGSDNQSSPYYGGQILSASFYDKENIDNIKYTIPDYISSNEDNAPLGLFLDMIGQHFDNLWLYAKNITTLYDNQNKIDQGISKDLVYYALQSLGVKLYNGNSNENIFDYLLGSTPTGNYQYTTSSFQTLVSASYETIPKQDITKEIYKRIYNNLPYLLKNKGTERGIKALITCYGIPSTILGINEYGGSDKYSNTIEYIYDRFAYYLQKPKNTKVFIPWVGTTQNFIETGFYDIVPDSIEFRFKPTLRKNISSSQTILDLENDITGSTDLGLQVIIQPTQDVSASIWFQMSGSAGYVSSSTFTLPLYMTGSDGDTKWFNLLLKRRYGHFQQLPNNSIFSVQSFHTASDQWYDLYVKTIAETCNSIGHQGSASLFISGGLNSPYWNFNSSPWTPNPSLWNTNLSGSLWQTYNSIWFNPGIVGSGSSPSFGATYTKNLYLGGKYYGTQAFTYYPQFSGSFQEFRLWSEPLPESSFNFHTLNPESFEGYDTGSAYNYLTARFPLGANLIIYDHSATQTVSSTHPNQNITYGSASLNKLLFDGSFVKDVFPYQYFTEYYYNNVPNTGFSKPVTEKIRIIDNDIFDNTLSSTVSVDSSSIELTKDIHLVNVSLSPQNEINKDIINHLGSTFNIDDLIGDPSYETSSSYLALDLLKQEYFKKYLEKYNYFDYIRLIKYFDNSLFKMIKDYIPARSNVETGIVIQPHLLERNKLPRHTPEVDNTQNYTSSLGEFGIVGDSTYISDIGDLSDFFTGELSGSTIYINNDYFQPNNINPYLVSQSFTTYFSGSEWDVLLNNVSQNITSTVRKRINYLGI